PRTVDVASLGVEWQAEATLPANVPGMSTGMALAVLQGSPTQIFPHRRADRVFPNGALEYDESAGGYLAIPIGPWTVVGATEAVGSEQRAIFAAALSGHVDRYGYLVLTPRAPVTLRQSDGPDIQFGDDVVGLLRRP